MELKRKPNEAHDLVWERFYVDKETGHRWDVDSDGEPVKIEGREYEVLEFGLKYLTTDEDYAITTAVSRMRTTTMGRHRREASIDTSFDHTKLVKLKLSTAIVEWRGVLVNGKPAPINEETVGLLTSWISSVLLDRKNAMNEVSEEFAGE